MGFFGGTPGGYESVSTLTKPQRGVHKTLTGAATQAGAGGAFGTAADYYRNLLSDNPEDMQAFAAPELRRFREQTIPDISEQFAGMGSGGLSSSGFRNAAVGAGTDLSERLGALRANLRQQGAQGLFNIGQASLSPVKENIYQQGQPGFLQQMAPAIGTGIGAAVGGPIGAGIGGGIGSGIGSWFGGNSQKGQTSPYGGAPKASPQSNFALPSFDPRMR